MSKRLAAEVLAEAAAEVCREPAGTETGGQFATCGGQATAPLPDIAPSHSNKVADNPRSLQPPPVAPTVDQLVTQIVGPEPGTEPNTGRIWRSDRANTQPGDEIATHWGGRGNANEVMNGGVNFYIEPNQGVTHFTVGTALGGAIDKIRFTEGSRNFVIETEQLRKLLAVPGDMSFVRIVAPAPAEDRNGFDIYVDGSYGTSFKERYHLSIDPGNTRLALVEREAAPDFMRSVAIEDRDKAQVADIRDWIAHTTEPGPAFTVRGEDGFDPDFTTLRDIPLSPPRAPPPVIKAPGGDWVSGNVEQETIPAGPGLLNGEDVDTIVYGQSLKDADWTTHAAALAGAPPMSDAIVTGTPTQATISVVGDHVRNAGDHVVTLTEENGEKHLHLNYMFFTPSGTGLGKQVLASIVNAAREQGIKSISLFAGGNGPKGASSMNGYYTWPRLGFDAEIPSHLTEKMLDDGFEASSLNELFNLKGGKEWWQENGESGYMEFDTRDGSASMRTLGRYLKESWGQNPFGAKNEEFEVEGELVLLDEADVALEEAEAEICRKEAGSPEGGQFASCGNTAGSPTQAVPVDPGASQGSTGPNNQYQGEIASPTGDRPVNLQIGGADPRAGIVGRNVEFYTYGSLAFLSLDNVRAISGAPPGSTITITREPYTAGTYGIFVDGDLSGHSFNERGQLTFGREGQIDYSVVGGTNSAALPRALWQTPEFRDRESLQRGAAELAHIGFHPRGEELPAHAEFLTADPPTNTDAETQEQTYKFHVGDPATDAVYFQMSHGDTVFGRGDKLVFALSPALGGGVAEVPKTVMRNVMGAPPDAIVTIIPSHNDGTWNTSVRGTLANVSFTELGKIAIDSDGRFTYSIDSMRTTGSLPADFARREERQADAARVAPVSMAFNPNENPPVAYDTPGHAQPDTHTPEEHTPPVSHVEPVELDEPMFFTGRNVRVRNTVDTDELDEPDWVGEAAAMVGAPPGARVHVYNSYSDEYKVESDFDGGSAEITVNPDENSVYFDSLFLDNDAQGTGLGTRIMSSALMAAHSNGFDTFDLSAAGSYGGSMNGYYTWPRLGFDGHLNSSSAEQARKDLGVGKDRIGDKISDLFKVEGGPDWWKRHGYGFHATFDLDMNGPSFKALGNYLKHRFGENPFRPESAGHAEFPGSGFESVQFDWLAEVETAVDTNLCHKPAGTSEGGQFTACDISAEVGGIVAQNLFQFPIPDVDPELAAVFHEPTMATTVGDVTASVGDTTGVYATTIERDPAKMHQFTSGYVEINNESSAQIGTPIPAGTSAEEDVPEGKISFPVDAGAPHHFEPLMMDQELLRRLVGARADGSIRVMDEANGYKILVSGPKIDGYGSAEGMYHLRTDSTGQWHLWRGAGETGIFKDGHYDTSAVIGRQNVQKDARDELLTLGGSTEPLFSSNVKFTVEDGIEFNPDTGEVKLSFSGPKSGYDDKVGGIVAKPGEAKLDATFDIQQIADMVGEKKHLTIETNTKGGYDLTVSGSGADWELGYSEHKSPSYGDSQTLTLTSSLADESVDSEDDLPTYDDTALALPKGVKLEVELPSVNEPDEEESDDSEDSSDSTDFEGNMYSREAEFKRSLKDAQDGDLPEEDKHEYVRGMKEMLTHVEETRDAVDSMNDYQREALNSYLGSGSQAIGNAQQGKGGCSGETCHAFDRGLDQLPEYHGTSWHGRNYTKERAAEFLADVDVGDVLTWGRSYSSSVSRVSGDNFTKTLLFKIEGGRSGRTIGLISPHSDEFEVLFPKGVRMKVTKIEPDRTPGQTLVTVEEFFEEDPEHRRPIFEEVGEQIAGDLCRKPAGEGGGQFTSCNAGMGDAVPVHGPEKIVTQQKIDMAMISPREVDPELIGAFTRGHDIAISGETPMRVRSAGTTITSDTIRLGGDRSLAANDPAAGVDIPRDQFIRMVGAPEHSHVEIKGIGPHSYTIDVTGSVGGTPIQDQLNLFYRSEQTAREMNNTTGVRIGNVAPFSSGWVLESDKYSVIRTMPINALTTEDARETVMRGAWKEWEAQGHTVEKLVPPEEDAPEEEDTPEERPTFASSDTREPLPHQHLPSDILGTEAIFDGSEVNVLHNETGYSDDQISRLAGAPPGSTVTVEKSDYDSSITLMVKGDHTNDQMVRLNPEQGTMSWSRYFPNEGFQRGDLGTKIFGTIVDAARELGFERIAIHAIGDHRSATDPNPKHRASGYLAWVKLGGNASLSNVDFAREAYGEEARKNGWHTIADIVNTKGGMSWWFHKGGEWTGDFDTRDGSYSMKRLGSKMKQKFGKNPYGKKNEFAEGEFFDETYNEWTP